MRATFQTIVIVAAVLGLGAGAAFAGGVVYGRQSTPESSTTQSATPSAGAGGAAAAGAGGAGARAAAAGLGSTGGAQPTAGTVEEVNGETVTVRTQAGGTVEVKLTPDTQLTKLAPAAAADVQPGTQVVVTGQPDTDGKIAAQSVQIGGAGRPGGGAPAPDASPAGTQSP